MKERLYLIDLYDIYGSLLIHKHIKDACEKLNYYEEKLKINEKNKKILEISKKLDKELQNKIEEII